MISKHTLILVYDAEFAFAYNKTRKGWGEARAGGLKGEGDCGKEKRGKGEVMGGKFLK